MRLFAKRAFAVAVLLSTVAQSAGAVEIDAFARGQYPASGFDFFGLVPTNYFVGDGFEETRNAFIFDLAPVGDTIVAASFQIFLPSTGFSSPQGSETYQLYDFTLPPASLFDGGVAKYVDLGTGDVYGTPSSRPPTPGAS